MELVCSIFLNHFVQEELRFTRRFPLRIVLPERYRRHSQFLASVFGALPKNTESVLREHWSERLDASWIHCESHSYAELLNRDTLFPRRLSSLFVGKIHGAHWGRRDCIFFMDAGSMGDIIDFWNLRAAGWNVIPVPVQSQHSPMSRPSRVNLSTIISFRSNVIHRFTTEQLFLIVAMSQRRRLTHSSGTLTLGRQRMPKDQSLSYSDGIPASGILGHVAHPVPWTQVCLTRRPD